MVMVIALLFAVWSIVSCSLSCTTSGSRSMSAPAENAPQTQPETAEERPVYDPEAPNANPVEAGPAVAPRDENGKIDATKIADANDFGDWEEQGCKG